MSQTGSCSELIFTGVSISIIPGYSDAVELVKKGLTIEAQEKIISLREATIALEDRILILEEENRDLKKQLEIKGKIKYEAPYYWLSEGEERDGPYCQVCYDKEGKLIRLQVQVQGRWLCLSCGKGFQDSTYRRPNTTPNRGGSRERNSWLRR